MVLQWFCLGVNEKAKVLDWVCLGVNEKTLVLHLFCLGVNANTHGFYNGFAQGSTTSIGFTLVLLRFCLGVNEKTMVLQLFAYGFTKMLLKSQRTKHGVIMIWHRNQREKHWFYIGFHILETTLLCSWVP